MENTGETHIPHIPAPQPKWFHNAWFSRGTLVIAGLFFLLPFININCSGTKLASIRGIDMVIGSELKTEAPKTEEKVKEAVTPAADSLTKSISSIDSLTASLSAASDSLTAGLKELTDSFGAGIDKALKEQNPFGMPMDMMGEKDKKIDPNPVAIVAFAFIILALVFSFFKSRGMVITGGALSIISALSLFFIQVQITSEIQKQMGSFNFIPITFEFTSFYWLCILLTVIAAVFSFIKSSLKGA
jgi:hypothetical protein